MERPPEMTDIYPEDLQQQMIDSIIPFDDVPAPSGSDFQLTWMVDAKAQVGRNYLIKGLLTAGAMSVVYGDSNTGKTFVALDMAYHVAAAIDFNGRKVKQGTVIYIAAEGGRMVENRLAALRQEFGSDAPLAILPQTINLLDSDADLPELLKLVAGVSKSHGEVVLIVIDTLSRVIAGGEENSSKDMSSFVRNVDQLRQQTGAAVLVVHHTGKDAAKGARGHSSLRAATDTEIEIKERTLRVTKQRDGPGGDAFGFNLTPVDLGPDQEGDRVTSCVVKWGAAPAKAGKKLSGNQPAAMEELRGAIIEVGVKRTPRSGMPTVRAVPREVWWTRFQMAGISQAEQEADRRRAFNKMVTALKNKGIVGEWNRDVWIAERSERTGTE